MEMGDFLLCDDLAKPGEAMLHLSVLCTCIFIAKTLDARIVQA
ncbi:hypothetical protein P368_18325 [Comamonas thiooxydans]|nr:hypothetical protein P365_22865 [Comamonas thiooxydans]KGH09222.1 hypothetical protein P368_18325 [Comamonas thiooxydans]